MLPFKYTPISINGEQTIFLEAQRFDIMDIWGTIYPPSFKFLLESFSDDYDGSYKEAMQRRVIGHLMGHGMSDVLTDDMLTDNKWLYTKNYSSKTTELPTHILSKI